MHIYADEQRDSMGFRTVEITGPAELHVRSGSLHIEKELPVQDIDLLRGVKNGI